MLTNKGCKNKLSQIRRGQKYHCRACYLELTVKLKVCPQDDRKFKRKFTGQVCCSPKCAFTYRAKNKTRGWEVPCTHCGKMFYKMPSRISSENFFNSEHRSDYFKSKQTTIKNSKTKNKREWTVEQRQEARQRKLGIKNTVEQNLKIKLHNKYGKDNRMWKGDFASYAAMHMWVVRHNGKARKCIDELFAGLDCKGRFEWSNKDHKYKRDLNDYHERCTRHHRIYDILRGLTIPRGKQAHFFVNANGLNILDFTMDAIIIERNDMR